MLITWRTGPDGRRDDGERIGGGLVVPDCCEAVQKRLSVVLAYGWNDLSDAPAYDHPEKPADYESWAWEKKVKWAVNDGVGERIEGKTRFDVAVPRWTVGTAVDYAAHHHRISREKPPVCFCPHCGVRLPEVERVPEDELLGPIHSPVSDGDYCGTCDERSRGCTCLYPTAAWRVKP